MVSHTGHCILCCLCSPGQPIDWDSDMGISLTSSLIHSPQQINFLIGIYIPTCLSLVRLASTPVLPPITAHEVAHLKHHDWLPRAVLPSVTLVIAYHVARVISCNYCYITYCCFAYCGLYRRCSRTECGSVCSGHGCQFGCLSAAHGLTQ